MTFDKRILIKKYFDSEELNFSTTQKFAKYGIILFFVGILLLYLQQIDLLLDNGIIIGILLILIGLFFWGILLKPFINSSIVFSSEVDDGDMDVWFLEDMHEIVKPRALEQLSINQSSLKNENIIIVPYPIFGL